MLVFGGYRFQRRIALFMPSWINVHWSMSFARNQLACGNTLLFRCKQLIVGFRFWKILARANIYEGSTCPYCACCQWHSQIPIVRKEDFWRSRFSRGHQVIDPTDCSLLRVAKHGYRKTKTKGERKINRKSRMQQPNHSCGSWKISGLILHLSFANFCRRCYLPLVSQFTFEVQNARIWFRFYL